MVGIPPNGKLQYKDEGTLVPERKSVPVAKLLLSYLKRVVTPSRIM
jgi:hypothetical protein